MIQMTKNRNQKAPEWYATWRVNSGRACYFQVIIDSGACAFVMPTEWCPHVDIMSTPQSRSKEFFRAANGQKIYDEGQKMVTMMTKEGTKRDMRFTVCDVSKALGSVSQMCRIGHRVIFNPPWDSEGSYIEHIDIGERMWMEEQGGLYVLNTKVAPQYKQTSTMNCLEDQWNKAFHWQVRP